jgi:hypothetical protein
MTALADDGKTSGAGRVVASSRMVCIRYPDGMAEFSSAAETPAVGDMVMRGGEKWPVVHVDADGFGNPVVTLGRLDGETDDDGSPSTRKSDEASA